MTHVSWYAAMAYAEWIGKRSTDRGGMGEGSIAEGFIGHKDTHGEIELNAGKHGILWIKQWERHTSVGRYPGKQLRFT